MVYAAKTTKIERMTHRPTHIRADGDGISARSSGWVCVFIRGRAVNRAQIDSSSLRPWPYSLLPSLHGNIGDDPFAFLDHVGAIGSQVPQFLLDSARPLDGSALDRLEALQAKGDAPVGLREVARTALHRQPADPFRRPDADIRANAG